MAGREIVDLGGISPLAKFSVKAKLPKEVNRMVTASTRLSKIPIERANGFKPSLLPELLLGLHHLAAQFNVLGDLLVKLDKLDHALYMKSENTRINSE